MNYISEAYFKNQVNIDKNYYNTLYKYLIGNLVQVKLEKYNEDINEKS